MTQRTRVNDNIISIFEGSGRIAKDEKSPRQRRDRQPVTVKVEAVTARFHLDEPIWRFVSNMCGFELRDQLLSLGVRPEDWYLSQDKSIVVMADDKEFPKIRENLKELLLRLYRDSPENRALIPPSEEPSARI